MSKKVASNIQWHHSEVSRTQRQEVFGHKGVTLWFSGLSGSGKSTVAWRIESKLVSRGVFAYVLDGDNIRHGLNKDLDFSKEGRQENIRRISEVAKLFNDAGGVVLTAFISPFREDRANAKKIIGEDVFIEVYVSTPLEVCEKRDPKGLYKKARKGEIEDFTGIQSPYEPPENPQLTIDTSQASEEECAQMIMDYLSEHGFIPEDISNFDPIQEEE